MQITDATEIATIRSGEFADQVVMVSDTIIPPPVPPETPNYEEVLAAYTALVAQIGQQQAALNAANLVNGQQTTALSAQSQQIDQLTNAVNVLAAKLENPNGGPSLPPYLADDLPLAEDDGVVLITNSGTVLVGDVR
jgi:hypothetical protein